MSTTTSHDEIGRNSTCTDDSSSGSSDTSFRLRRLSQMISGSSQQRGELQCSAVSR